MNQIYVMSHIVEKSVGFLLVYLLRYAVWKRVKYINQLEIPN